MSASHDFTHEAMAVIHYRSGREPKAVHFAVAGFVAGNLLLPKLPVVFGDLGASGMPVPEFPVHKHRNSLLGKGEIGLPEERVIPSPTLDCVLAEKGDQFQLSRLVALAPDAGHDLRSLLLGEDVGHSGLRCIQPVHQVREQT